jgi:molecular chaperone DnaJ
VLSDEKRRKEYDEARSLFGGGFRVPTGSRPGTGNGGGFNFDLGDLFGNNPDASSGGLGDLFGTVFNRGGTRTTAANRPRRGADVETETTLSFSDAIEGTTVGLRLTGEGPCPTCHGTGAKAGTVPKVCPVCGGTGQSSRNLGSFGISEPCKECRGRGLVVEDPCPSCSGSGRAMSSRTIQARIPAGVADGQRIKLAGKGAPGERGGPAGDLYVRVHVKPHPVFGRSGENLTVTVPVTFAELALGAEVKVPAHGGAPVTVRIPPGTPNGRTFRVAGKGVRRKDGTTGALLVTVEVTVPQNLNGKARSAIEDLREATAGADPREELLARAKEA